jgi:dienelactone hydrolase
MRIFVLAILLALGLAAGAEAKVVGKTIMYEVNGKPYKGYLTYDDAIEGKRPGILVMHEWWGHDAYARRRAEMLARLGYTAFALDMYGPGKLAKHPKDAKAFMTALFSSGEVKDRLRAAAGVLTSLPQTDGTQLGAIGYCMGGALALGAARHGMPNVKAVAAFHASLGTQSPAKPGAVKAEVLVMNGADDPFVKPEHVEAFKAEMDAAGATYAYIAYPGAVHSFTNPEATERGREFGMPLRYDAQAEQDSWRRMQLLFNRAFSKN